MGANNLALQCLERVIAAFYTAGGISVCLTVLLFQVLFR